MRVAKLSRSRSMNRFSFYACYIKPSRFLQGANIESIFAKRLQKPDRFFWLLQNPS